MTLAADIAHDYLYMDGVEDVTLERPAQGSTPLVQQTGCKGLPRVVTQRSMISAGNLELQPNDCVFHVWKATCGSFVPRRYDVLIDADSQRWSILGEPSLETLKTRYRLVCRKEV